MAMAPPVGAPDLPSRSTRALDEDGSALPERILSDQQISRLRDIRAVLLDMRALIAAVRNGDATVQTYAAFLTDAIGRINATLREVKADSVPAEDSDAICHLANLCNLLSANPLLVCPDNYEKQPGSTSQTMARDLSMADSLIDKLAFQIGLLTVPARLNRWLAQARTGYYVPFHEVFDDELPHYEDRVRILKFLSWSPKTIKYGLVDASTGLIYRYGRDGRGRVLAVVAVVALIAAMSAAILGSANLQWIPGWPVQATDASRLLGLWLGLLSGVVVHVAVATAKRVQAQSELPPVLPVGDIPRLISAKFGQIAFKILLAVIGLYGSIFVTGFASVTLLQAFLTGYSLDSVVELFGASMEQRATAQITTLKQQLGVK